MPPRMRTDVHQHLLPEDLISALSRRTTPPGSPTASSTSPASHPLRSTPRTTTRPPAPTRRPRPHRHRPVERARHRDPPGRRGRAAARRLQPRHPRARPPVRALGRRRPRHPARADVDDLLDAGALGISLPATAIADRRGLRRVAPLLDRLEARGAPLFVHPGPRRTSTPSAPPWWPALTTYVADMSAAWHAFATWGRPCHPQLRIVYAMLAGGAPLHAERLRRPRWAGRRDPRPAGLVRGLLLRAARARRDDPRDRDRPPALRLRPPGRRAARARRARRRAVGHALQVTNPGWAFSSRATVAVLA